MATLFCVSSNPISHPSPFPFFSRAPPFPNCPPLLRIPASARKQRSSSAAVVARAGPTINSIIFAIALPSSLLAVTVFGALKMGDKLDREWLDEVAKIEALKEVEEDGDGDDSNDDIGEEDSMGTYVQEEPALSRARNRPKREA